jgi:sensor histidine kinase YesM
MGLAATRERLYGLYGHAASMEVRSTIGKGTIVEIQLPFNTEPLSRAYELESIHGLV